MERSMGPPLGTATQSTGRPMPDGGSASRSALSTSVKRAPQQHVRQGTSSSSTSTSTSNSTSSSTVVPLSAGQVVTLAREAMKLAMEDNKSQDAEASAVSAELKPGLTIDLSRNNIQRFPDEVVDIIKDDLVRLALSHNQISSLPARFAECSLLRYLNIRNNLIREIPACICRLQSLEILDLGRNKLKVLPPELTKLTSLKVLAVQRNRIEELPIFLADMNSLQMIKFEENPIRFPPEEILQPPSSSPPTAGQVRESEAVEVTVTAQIKRFLKQKMVADITDAESGEESSEGTETPRPLRRVASGRFPIKVNGTDVTDLRSPALPRPPPIPTRSHYRGLSQQNPVMRRSGVVPLAITSSNERVRSNSETLLRQREGERDMRRASLLNRTKSELGTVHEVKANRFSYHSRGLSHGSAMQGNAGINARNSTEVRESPSQQTLSIWRLSSVPERKRVGRPQDPVVEGAKGILFALFHIHPLIQGLINLVSESDDKRSSLEAVFYNASFHVEELDRDIRHYERELDENDAERPNENVHRACLTCVSAYIHVCALLSKQTEELVHTIDPRYVRTLMLSLYGSLMEIRNATISVPSPQGQTQHAMVVPPNGGTLRPQPHDRLATPIRERLGVESRRSRSGTVIRDPNLRVTTNVPPVPLMNGNGRSQLSLHVAATPRSGESFVSTTSRGTANGDFTEEDRLFDNVFLHLQQSSDLALKTLPNVNTHIIVAMKNSVSQNSMDQSKQWWQLLSQKCAVALQAAESLKARLSLIKLKEPGIRTQAAFWDLCNSFINAYTDLALKIREAKTHTRVLPIEVIELLRPLQRLVSKTSKLIQTSPWSFLPNSHPANTTPNGYYGIQSPASASQAMMPMTPASAALGPAVQATVPATPQSASSSYGNLFSSNVFERADALLSMNSTFSSRAGTMSAATMSAAPHDGSTLSPGGSMHAVARLNGKAIS